MMKAIVLLIALALTTLSLGQYGSGIEFRSESTLNRVNFYENTQLKVSRQDGSHEQFNDSNNNRSNNYWGLKVQLGYRFVEHWSAGLQGGFGISIVGFDYVIPQFGFHTNVGAYGRYHFNKAISLVGTVGTSHFYRHRSNLSFGLGAQLLFGANSQYGVHILSELGLFGNNKYDYPEYGIDEKGLYKVEQVTIKNRSFMLEFGVVRKIF